jgi:hypothetical protein
MEDGGSRSVGGTRAAAAGFLARLAFLAAAGCQAAAASSRSSRCGRALGQLATARRIARVPDSSAAVLGMIRQVGCCVVVAAGMFMRARPCSVLLDSVHDGHQ